MGLYEKWENQTKFLHNKQQVDSYWKEYFLAEKQNYIKILEEKRDTLEGKVSDLAASFDMDAVTFSGFLDGINTSLEEELDIAALEEDTEIKAKIDFEKLYWNMHEAKAPWLYELEEWDGLLTAEKRSEIAKNYRKSKIVTVEKIGRNDPCPCGSGKKYKNCCGE